MIARYRDGAIPRVPVDRRRRGGSRRSATTSREARPLRPDRRARRIWGRRPRAERLRDEQKPWELAKDEAQRGRARRGALHARRRAPRRRGRARAVPAGDGAADPRRARPAATTSRGRTSPTGSRSRPRGSSPRRRSSRASSVRRRGVIDTHAHLDACDEPGGVARRARPRGRGRRGSSRSAAGSSPARRRSRSPSARTASSRRSGFHPHQAGEPSRPSTRCASCSRIRRPSPWGRPGSTTSATTRRATRRRALRARSSRSPRSWASRSSSTRARPTPTRSPRSRGFAGTVVLHCFSSLGAARARARARLVRVVRRERHLSEGGRAALGRRARPGRADPRRDRQPVPLAPARARAARTSPRTSCTRSPRSPRPAGDEPRRARARRSRRTPTGCSALP